MRVIRSVSAASRRPRLARTGPRPGDRGSFRRQWKDLAPKYGEEELFPWRQTNQRDAVRRAEDLAAKLRSGGDLALFHRERFQNLRGPAAFRIQAVDGQEFDAGTQAGEA